MARPSISAPDALIAEVDDRRHATKDRSRWVTEAIVARLNAEDAGDWSTPDMSEWTDEPPVEAQ